MSPAPEPAPHATVSAELADAFGMKEVPGLIEIKPAPEPDLEAEHRRETTQEVLAEFPTFYVNADEPQPEREYDPDFELDEPDPKFLP